MRGARKKCVCYIINQQYNKTENTANFLAEKAHNVFEWMCVDIGTAQF